MNKTKKIVLIVLAVIMGLLIIAAGAGVGVYQFYIKPKINAVTQSENGEKSNFNANKILEEVETTIQEEDIKNYLNEEDPNNSEELLGTIQEAKERNEQKNTQVQENKSSEKKTKYEEIKEQVAPADLKDGMALASKVDAGYILGLLSGGLTAEEKSELKAYLTARLSSGEISRGIELFAKYSYLL